MTSNEKDYAIKLSCQEYKPNRSKYSEKQSHGDECNSSSGQFVRPCGCHLKMKCNLTIVNGDIGDGTAQEVYFKKYGDSYPGPLIFLKYFYRFLPVLRIIFAIIKELFFLILPLLLYFVAFIVLLKFMTLNWQAVKAVTAGILFLSFVLYYKPHGHYLYKIFKSSPKYKMKKCC